MKKHEPPGRAGSDGVRTRVLFDVDAPPGDPAGLFAELVGLRGKPGDRVENRLKAILADLRDMGWSIVLVEAKGGRA